MPRISKRYNLDLNRIEFEISVTFPEGDPDAVIANLAQLVPYHHNVKGRATPIEVTVAKYISVLFDESIRNKIFGKAEICKSYGLMQNFCSITFEVDLNELKELSELQGIIDNCKKVMRSYAHIIRYYKDNTEVGRSIGICSFS